MINGLGVVGWGVGGIEAEGAMLGQPLSMLIPQVVGFKLHGRLPEGTTATDAVLTVTQMLRAKGVVGKFVEFYGSGLSNLSPRRPRDHRQHGAGIWRNNRILPDRRRNAQLPASDRTRRQPGCARRSVRESSGHCSALRTRRIRFSPTRWNWISPPSNPALPGRVVRRIE